MIGGTREVRCEGREVSACWVRVRENGVRRVECVCVVRIVIVILVVIVVVVVVGMSGKRKTV